MIHLSEREFLTVLRTMLPCDLKFCDANPTNFSQICLELSAISF